MLRTFLVCCTAAVVAGAVTGCASADQGSGDVTPTASTTATVTDVPDEGAPDPVVRPDGFAGLRLGMSAEEVRATGDATVHDDVGGPCRTFTLTGDVPAADADSETDGFVSKEYGLAAVFARPGLRTPEGVGMGSTLPELESAYPAGDGETGWFRVSLGAGREYEFAMGQDDVVEGLSVRLVTQDCFG